MSKPQRKSPAGRRGLGNSTCLGRRDDYTATALPASVRFDSDGLVLPCPRRVLNPRDADAVSAAIIASGALDDDPTDSRPNGWRLYRGKWFGEYGGKTYRTSHCDVDTWLHCLLSKCIVIDRAGRMRPFLVLGANVRAVRCALGRALTVHVDPMRELAAVGDDRD
jgi:hypothetical protein